MTGHKSLYFVLLIGLLTIISVTGCGNSSEKNDQITKRIGIIQIVEHPSLNSIRESFIKQLAVNGFKEGSNLKIDYQNAQGDPNNLKMIAQKFKNENYDLIIPIATPSAQAIAGETKDIPIIFAAVTDPVAAGLVQNLQKPGGNITGTSDVTSAEQNIKLALQITPGVHKLGAIYNPGETAAVMVMNELRKYLKSSGEKIELIEMTVSNTGDVQQIMQTLVGKVDAIFAPPDNTIASSMAVVSNVAKDAKKPLYVGADSMVKDGALAGYGVNYDILGQKTADMATQVLKGKKSGDIPVEVMTELDIYTNTDTAKAIGISIPQDVLKKTKENFGK